MSDEKDLKKQVISDNVEEGSNVDLKVNDETKKTVIEPTKEKSDGEKSKKPKKDEPKKPSKKDEPKKPMKKGEAAAKDEKLLKSNFVHSGIFVKSSFTSKHARCMKGYDILKQSILGKETSFVFTKKKDYDAYIGILSNISKFEGVSITKKRRETIIEAIEKKNIKLK